MTIKQILILIPLLPLFAAALVGLFRNMLPRWAGHVITILGVGAAFALSTYIFNQTLNGFTLNEAVYTWLDSGDIHFEVGFLIDNLSAMMMVVVTFVSLMVHIYTIGYMAEDPGYARFFSYISLFTFSMLMLVMSNNFMQLFFGWEAVGLVSYLLIGFWFTRPTAIYANLKAFLVNRVGDFGFLLGIGMVLYYFGSLDYATVFERAPSLAATQINLWGHSQWSLMTVTCLLLFIGAMGKSAQVPLHVWLPDSMEGPTPISALIHAATMVTAGIFMVARMSPLYELSTTALSTVMVIGAITALFMGFLGIIQNDIKRVVAYSTLSQLGYMTVALGASAYSVAIFHLMTHAFFKALLFLGAGSVIMGMHHDQDIRNMGNLKKYLPITWITSLIGSLALIGTPFFAGFYSKDSIIEAVELSHIPGSGFAYFAVIVGVFVTAFYSFRLYFLVFHGEEKWRQAKHDDHAHATHVDAGHADNGHDDAHADNHDHDLHHGLGPNDNPHEPGWVVTLPLVLLAIPSLVIGYLALEPMLYGDFFKNVIFVNPQAHPAMSHLAHHYHELMHSPAGMAIHGFTSLPFFLAASGVLLSWFFYMKRPDIPAAIKTRCMVIYNILENKYGFDTFNEKFFAGGSRFLGNWLWKYGDITLIDGAMVNGTANTMGKIAAKIRNLQSGLIYHYAFAMIIGVFLLMTFFIKIN
ncbi:NADH-quinone oxidoreductase subunit L [Methylophilus medardicus]|uniref:NADH-quinone oxidoreductase subunit L n=1 Tax=Methylophilus medardicus TaxID=2588534 RepID=A0A5B8CRX3_9PROT|nr:NADH-quinone oxidoreductase subunit L [Methylophilus medardicus]QDC43816.1 NADH-quinone oxidoreductase subunit L [Methylophilus medardicus]QDC48823.1 NADH-quinone oxidoreductase subunit L [Methylophilus medardicus]QDC52528.1 NADH-quinone oxidoreductase subunit L [Methylophilus medardicus]